MFPFFVSYFLNLFVLALLCTMITLVLCYFSTYHILSFSATEQMLDDALATDSPATGWFVLGGMGIGMMADIGTAIMIALFTLIIPGFLLIGIVFLQGIARLVQMGSEKHWKNITSKVLTYISIILLVLVCLILLLDILAGIARVIILIFALVFDIVCVVLFIKALSENKKNNRKGLQKS